MCRAPSTGRSMYVTAFSKVAGGCVNSVYQGFEICQNILMIPEWISQIMTAEIIAKHLCCQWLITSLCRLNDSMVPTQCSSTPWGLCCLAFDGAMVAPRIHIFANLVHQPITPFSRSQLFCCCFVQCQYFNFQNQLRFFLKVFNFWSFVLRRTWRYSLRLSPTEG